MVDDKVYFSVQAWMVTKLGLKGCERDVFAIIYGYSQDGESDYHGNLGYIAELTGYSKNSICTALKNLTEKEFIIKTEKEINNIKFCRYKINCDSIQATCMGIQATCTNNNHNNKIDNKKNNSKELLQNSPSFEFGKSKPKKESLYTKCSSMIYAKTDNPEIQKLLFSWLNMLLEKYKDIGKVLYGNVFKGKLNMLDKYDKKDWKEIIEFNLQKGYEGFYPISNYRTSINEKPWEQGVKSEGYTEEEKRHIERVREEMIARGERVWY